MKLLAAAVAVALALACGLCLNENDWWQLVEQDTDEDEIARVDGELVPTTPALPLAALQIAILCRLGKAPDAQRSSRRVGRTRRGVVDKVMAGTMLNWFGQRWTALDMVF